MDADDVAAPARLAEQRAILLETDTDIVGTHLAEFRDDPNRPYSNTSCPKNPQNDIRADAVALST